MKNKEFYKREIIDFALDGYSFGVSNNNLIRCNTKNCKICNFYYRETDCNISRFEWADAEYIKPENDLFSFNKSDTGYYISANGGIVAFDFDNDEFCKKLIKFGNACKDKNYMEKKTNEIQLYNLLSNFAYEVNEGWEPNWDENVNQNKWCIYKSHSSHSWEVYCCDRTQSVNDVLFKTKELAERAINEIVIPFENDKQRIL